MFRKFGIKIIAKTYFILTVNFVTEVLVLNL